MKTITFNKDWMFIQNDNDRVATSYIAEGEAVDLPHSWNGRDGQGEGSEYYRGRCWYQKKLELSEAELQQRWYLEIGAAGNIGTVYINGHLAGTSRCGYAMFRVALQPFLKAGDNLIAIEVDNSYHDDVFPLMADFTFYGGLYREVRLLVMEPIHFDVTDLSRDGIYLTPVKTAEDTFRLGIRGRIANESEGQAEGQIQVQLRDRDGQLALETSVPVRIERATDFEFHMDIENPVLWDGVPAVSLHRYYRIGHRREAGGCPGDRGRLPDSGGDAGSRRAAEREAHPAAGREPASGLRRYWQCPYTDAYGRRHASNKGDGGQ
ncbi:sugar-binding domain-containing protein [Paenibacillus sp. 1P07SE]|uniref:sugar-binding domain-containing protein n=1 Tax=Paenibacillus sp. 1P07SE TaxID=3132209 RepID=UPI0039A61AC3